MKVPNKERLREVIKLSLSLKEGILTSAELDNHFTCLLSSVTPAKKQHVLRILGIILALSKAESRYRPGSVVSFIEEILPMSPGELSQMLEQEDLDLVISTDTCILNRQFSEFLLDSSHSKTYAVELSRSYNEIALGCLRVLDQRVLSIEKLPQCECTSQKKCEHNSSFFYNVLFECCQKTTLENDNNASGELRKALLAHKTEHLVNTLLNDSTDDRVWSTAALALCTFYERLDSLQMFNDTEIKSYHLSVLFKLDALVKDTLDTLCTENTFITDIFLALVSCIASPLAIFAGKRYRAWQHVASALLFHPFMTQGNANPQDRFKSIRDIIRMSDSPSYMLTALFALIEKSLGSLQENENEKTARFAVKALKFLTRGLFADMLSGVNSRFDSKNYFPKGVHVDDSSKHHQPWAYSMTYLASFLRTKERSGRYYIDNQKLERATVYCLSSICSSDIKDLQASSVGDIYDKLHIQSFTTVISRLLIMQMFGESKSIELSEDEILYIPEVASTETNGDLKNALEQIIHTIRSSAVGLPEPISPMKFPSSDIIMLAYLKNLDLEGPLRNNPQTLCFIKTDNYWGITQLGAHAAAFEEVYEDNSSEDGQSE
ncbi:hypothetical protein CVT25_000910 [Psilocybe cyanescens]|uniref:Uncharacterized protein n=1 Tax=Psilocybe cyanescens TaxID=93625 RepID=A0A409WZG5_PSICY|nr:hypothetical protein CVT25_000910 [Psilocybe cyanescens]